MPAVAADRTESVATTAHYRYPGAPPFGDNELDRRLFTGRHIESETVLHSILSSSLFVLYAQSGLGKTSLLNAGVSAELRARGHWPVSVRLNDTTTSPTTAIRERVIEAARNDPAIDVMIDDAIGDDPTLWDLLSGIEIWRGNVLQHLVLIFDQFEELFTLEWPDEVRRRFITEFGEVVRGHRQESSENGRPSVPPDVRFVLAIREDALGSIEELATDVPQILRHRYRLGPLDPERADEAIREPAGVIDDRLDSRQFEYTESAANEILNFLRTSSVRGVTRLTPGVDPSQLQIVCQYVERAIVPRKSAGLDPTEVIRIDAADLEGRAGLDRILSDFYRRAVATIPTARQKAVRRLCERGLINANERRVSLERSAIGDDFDVDPSTLEALVDARLLRGEERLDSVYYELAHDTLVPAILSDRAERTATRRRRRVIVSAVLALVAVAIVSSLAVAAALRSDPEPESESATEVAVPVSLDAPVDAFVEAEDQQSFIIVDAAPGELIAVSVESESTVTISPDDLPGASSVVSSRGQPGTLYIRVPEFESDPPVGVLVSAPGRGGSFRLAATAIVPVALADDELFVVDLDDAGGSAAFEVETTTMTAVVDAGAVADPLPGSSEVAEVDVSVEVLEQEAATGNDPGRAVITNPGRHVAIVRGSGRVAVRHESARPLDPGVTVSDALADESEIAYYVVDPSQVGGVLLEPLDGVYPMSVTMELSSVDSSTSTTSPILGDSNMMALFEETDAVSLVRVERFSGESFAPGMVTPSEEIVSPADLGAYRISASPRPAELAVDGGSAEVSGFALFEVDNTGGQNLEFAARPTSPSDVIRIQLLDLENESYAPTLYETNGTASVAVDGARTYRIAVFGFDEAGAPSDYDAHVSIADALVADAGPVSRSDGERFVFDVAAGEPLMLTTRSNSMEWGLDAQLVSVDDPQAIVTYVGASAGGTGGVVVGCDRTERLRLTIDPYLSTDQYPTGTSTPGDGDPLEYTVELRTLDVDPCGLPVEPPPGLAEPYVFSLLTTVGAPAQLANCTIDGWQQIRGDNAGLQLVLDLIGARPDGVVDEERLQAALAPIEESAIACGLDDVMRAQANALFRSVV